jgi:hypothetical protein
MKNFNTLCLFLVLGTPLLGQLPMEITQVLNWSSEPQRILANGEVNHYWDFEEAIQGDNVLPLFYQRFEVEGPGQLRVELLDADYTAFDWEKAPLAVEELTSQLNFGTVITRHREGYYGGLSFVPIIKQGSRYERLTSFKLRISFRPDPGNSIAFRGPDNTENSKLSDGNIYKIAVSESGMHKLTYSFLKEELGMDIDNIDPARIQLLGIPGGKLPYYSESPRTDDLAELPIWISGSDDGSFDSGDYLLFYGQGSSIWAYNESEEQFYWQQNPYDIANYYFVKVGSNNGQRIAEQPSLSNTAYTTSTYNDYSRFEPEEINILHEWSKTQGAGKQWFGDHFKVAREYTYPDLFQFENLDQSAPVFVEGRAALRARTGSSFIMQFAAQTLESNTASAIPTINTATDNTNRYAAFARISDSTFVNTNSSDVTLRYPFPQGSGDDSEGWVDWMQFNVRCNLIFSFTENQMAFRDIETLNYASSTFELQNADENLQVWDVTAPLQPQAQQYSLSGGTLRFGAETSNLRDFVAFDPSGNLLTPEAVGEIPNQNIHGITDADMVILYHPDFESAALRLAEHRADFNNISVELLTPGQVFNEFGGGRAEPTAIRDFCRMLYDRSDKFKYLLVVGDASFDNRDIYGLGGNFIPSYQDDSLNPVFAYPTDDLYGVLYGTNPDEPLQGDLNIAVGRLPVKTNEELERIIDKIINYDENASTLGDWRNQLVFVADDGDNNTHQRDADGIAEDIQEQVPFMNLEKIYLDAFPEESTPGGERYPLATEQLNRSVFKGAFSITYLGHGGPKGWAQERVLNISDILSWDNKNNMPIFITATCTFTGFDDPTFVSAGEEVILNPDGGAPALMTTVRPVYTGGNKRLTENAMAYLLSKDENGRPLQIGEAYRLGKNATSDLRNTRKFALIGDPAMPLALPQYNVATTAINGASINPLDSLRSDTLRALQKVTIAGVVLDNSGNVDTAFDGIVYPTLFDKAQIVSTLAQGNNSVFNYRIQNNVIFRGRASVTNGQFEFTFVVPKDINYELGSGKISYYAADESRMLDAAGSYEAIQIGGTDPNAIADDQGPQVEVYMNTEDFVFGSVVDPKPSLLVKLSDDNGINVVGNSIGHDLEGVLNEDTQNALLLNDFYESELDDYTKGTVRYPMNELPEGRHRIEVKAWDVANNSATGYTEFVVAGSGEVALQHVLNYPNPFTDRTCFQFDHNLANQELDILIQIYTISGRLVKTLQQTMVTDGALRQDDCLEWDGRDDFGDQLARGVYLYKVKLRAIGTGLQARTGESEFEKLVILK